MQTDLLRNNADEILSYLKAVPFSDATVRYYGCCYENLYRFCESYSIECFDHCTAAEYSEYQKLKADNGELSIIFICRCYKIPSTIFICPLNSIF